MLSILTPFLMNGAVYFDRDFRKLNGDPLVSGRRPIPFIILSFSLFGFGGGESPCGAVGH